MARIGYKHSEETKKKIALSRTGDKNPAKLLSVRIKISIAKKGKKLSPEHAKKSAENLSKYRGSAKGKTWKLSEQAKENHRIASLNRYKNPLERIKTSERQRGEKSHLWRGGITPINKARRNNILYKLWREEVFRRDNYTCVWCGAKNGNGKSIYLQADHIKPFSLYPEARLDINNGRTLCVPCHEKTESYPKSLLTKNNYAV